MIISSLFCVYMCSLHDVRLLYLTFAIVLLVMIFCMAAQQNCNFLNITDSAKTSLLHPYKGKMTI